MSYTFETPFPPGHFVRDYLEYASMRTDAAHVYHEAAGLALLALATPRIRARLAPYPKGLPTNLYLLLMGDSTRSRKSTAISLATDIADAALPGSRIPDAFSPEAFIEHLAGRPRNSTLWTPDEFGEMLVKLRSVRYLAGLLGLLLTLYAGNDYEARRHSKRVKGGGSEQDVDSILEPSFSILGATTPTVFEALTEADITNGLLPRFAIMMPDEKPDRKPFYAVSAETDQARNRLISRLHAIHTAALDGEHAVQFSEDALKMLDLYAETLENDADAATETAHTMKQRLVAMSVKVAMLSAAGRPDGLQRSATPLIVDMPDADIAVRVVMRWEHDAMRFAERVGESRFETILQKCLRIVLARKAVPRSVIAQNAHVSKKILDDIEATLLDRKLIEVREEPSSSGPARMVWEAAKAREFAVIQGGRGNT